jgi:hypothetical protein
MDDERRRTALHEASHCVCAAACGLEVTGATVRPGTAASGCSRFRPPILARAEFDRTRFTRPYLTFPAAVRHNLEVRTAVSLAGELGELALAEVSPHMGGNFRSLPSVAERASELAASLPEPDPGEVADLLAYVDDPDARSDEQDVWHWSYVAHGRDLVARCAWLGHLEAQALAIIYDQAERIIGIADLLGEVDTLDASMIAAAMR